MKYISRPQSTRYRFKVQPYPGLLPSYSTYEEALEIAKRLIKYDAGKIRTKKGFKTAEDLIEYI